ncbi:MAG: indolepyruvate ferredoxin oxidoreductase subunit alpha [Promethearchaeota archaeon]
MIEESLDIYRSLQLHLDEMPVGYPKTESGVEIRLLKILFTPEEAYFATLLEFFPQEIESIHRKIKDRDISIEELEMILKKMFQKGTIEFIEKEGKKTYANALFAIGMYEYQLGRLTPDLVKNVFQYFEEAFIHEFNKTGIPQLRVIPVEESVSYDLPIANFDQIRYIISNTNTIGIMDCVCRRARELVGEPCKTTNLRETCMTFGFAAKLFHEKGLARFITKEEALQLINNFEQVGLVPQTSNSKKPKVICNCCGCCCEVIKNQKRLKNPSQYFTTNFHVEISTGDCIGCGICEERCPMGAIRIVNEKSKHDIGKCIGCGVCVPTCPENAIVLVKNEREIIPPVDTKTTYEKIMIKKTELNRNR